MFRTSDKIRFLSETKITEANVRLVLHELYSDKLHLLERKMERIHEYVMELRSPEVDFATLMGNSILDEDNLRWLEKDYELLAMAYPEWRRPPWVKRFQGN